MPSFKAYVEIDVEVDYDLDEHGIAVNSVLLGTIDLTDHLIHEEIQQIQQIEQQIRDHEIAQYIAQYKALEAAQADRADDIRKYGRDG